eukprot:322783-Chlamydomonas_euryale.AAC.10
MRTKLSQRTSLHRPHAHPTHCPGGNLQDTSAQSRGPVKAPTQSHARMLARPRQQSAAGARARTLLYSRGSNTYTGSSELPHSAARVSASWSCSRRSDRNHTSAGRRAPPPARVASLRAPASRRSAASAGAAP